MFVYDRTIGWSKEWEVITGVQASEGVWSADKTFPPYAAPITKKRDRATECLHSLVDDGFLRRTKSGKFYRYALNLDPMKIPKRLQEAMKSGSCDPVSGHTCDPVSGHVSDPVSGHKEYPSRRVSKGEEESAPRPTASSALPTLREQKFEIETAMLDIKAKSKLRSASPTKGKFARRANDDGTGTGFVPYRNALPALLRSLHAEHFPSEEMATIPYLSLNILHQYATNWTLARKTGEFMDFLTWIFMNWTALGAGVFAWMKDFPPSPSVRIITSAKLRGFIEEAFLDREKWDRWRNMNDYERRVQHLVSNRGMTQEKAEFTARKETGFRDEMKSLEEERRMIQVLAARSMQAIEQERITLAKQKRNQGKQPLKQTEGSFGKF
jgi:hypothetical protein